MKLADQDIRTREVLQWKGLHVLHFPMSSCSAKLRIFLNIKKVSWNSHIVDLIAGNNISEWFLGINPRGLVPVLVHDGQVHIESNDILVYLDDILDGPRLIPTKSLGEIKSLLRHEDDLHLSLRALTLRFVLVPPAPPKTPEMLAQYSRLGSGTVKGSKDLNKETEIAFWKQYATAGVSDDDARVAVNKFRLAFDRLDQQLGQNRNLLGPEITVLDIAWFIYVNRLVLAGYPIDKLHGRLAAWFSRLQQSPEFASEIVFPPPLRVALEETRRRQAAEASRLIDVMGLT